MLSKTLVSFLVFLHKRLNIKDSDKFFDTISNLLDILANVIDVVAVILIALFLNRTLIVIFAIFLSMLIRQNRGEHYDTFKECLISGIVIYSCYAVLSLMINNIILDILVGYILAFLMIDYSVDY